MFAFELLAGVAVLAIGLLPIFPAVVVLMALTGVGLASPSHGFQAYRSRHTGITNWVRQGVEAPIVQQLAGHKSISTTQLYIGRMQKSDIRRRVPLAFTATYGRAV